MISTTSSSVSYTGNASTETAYPIPFAFLAAAHVSAYKTSSAGVVTSLALGTDYSVSSNADSNGRITNGELRTVVALPGTETLTIRRLTPATQTVDFVDGGQFSAETLESALDKAIMVAQESVRDALGGGETNVEVAGTGIVVQTAPATFSSRAIGVAAGSGLSITNGDGVAGNPVIDLDGAALDVVTTAADTDTVRIETASGSQKITVPNLIARQTIRQVQLPISAASVAEGTTGITLNLQYINFATTVAGSASIRFYLPTDFASGSTVKVKFRSYLFNGINTDQYRLTAVAYNENGLTPSIMLPIAAQNLLHSSVDTRTPVFALTGLEGGSFYSLSVSRDTANIWDTATAAARVTDFVIEYPSQDAAGW